VGQAQAPDITTLTVKLALNGLSATIPTLERPLNSKLYHKKHIFSFTRRESPL